MKFANSWSNFSGASSDRPNSLPMPALIRNPVVLLLFWASKTDPKIAFVCSHWSQSTLAALGVLVLFTAGVALGAAYYTLATMQVAPASARLLAIAWAIFILFLDREVVGSLDRKTAVIRPLLAMIIGTIIAIPIELWVFQDRIDQELTKEYLQNNREQFDYLRPAQTALGDRRIELRATLTALRKEEADWGKVMDDELVGRAKSGRSGVSGAGPVFKNAENQQATVRHRIQEVHDELAQLERSLPQERQHSEIEFQRTEVAKMTTFVTRYEALDRVVRSSRALYRLSWGLTLFCILLEMTAALMKLLAPHLDYHHLVSAEIRENVARIDEIADRNYQRAIENPEIPQLSVTEKFTIVRLHSATNVNSFGTSL